MIEIFDNILTFKQRHDLWESALASNYRVHGWSDQEGTEWNVHSEWSTEDYYRSGLSNIANELLPKSKKFDTKDLNKDPFSVTVNLVRPCDVHYVHTHKQPIGMLYYANLNWKEEWAGETIFYNKNDLSKIEFCSPFVPGRVILFDATLPHTIRPQSNSGPKYRFTYSAFFTRKTNE